MFGSHRYLAYVGGVLNILNSYSLSPELPLFKAAELVWVFLFGFFVVVVGFFVCCFVVSFGGFLNI